MENVFKKVHGSITLDGINGVVTISIAGDRVPQNTQEVPEYVAQCVKKALFGANDSEVASLKNRISELQAQVEKLIDEKKALATEKRSAKSRV